MFPTYARKLTMLSNKTSIALLIAGALGLSAPAHARQVSQPPANAVTVSDYEFNTFVFPDTIKRLFFPAGSPVVGKPVYLADNTQVMLQFAKSTKAVQMVAELQNGTTITLRVQPKAVVGISHVVNGARVKGSGTVVSGPSKGAGQEAAPRGEDIELLKQLVVAGEPPSDFAPTALPAITRFDKFSVVPLAGWANGLDKRIFVFSLVSQNGQTAVVAPSQFYRPGITAVMVDGDVVDAQTSPQLFIVEDLADE